MPGRRRCSEEQEAECGDGGGHGAIPDSGASGYPWPSAWAILGPLGAVPQVVCRPG